ncbi:ABC transporter ATP-binding protein [Clostridium pasteurianum]|uniref:ABC-type multidrug transport system, ATPase and permease component n=1 Tax=Clostridium pasteurianum BC1 TaxID=86416 RepID=R4KHR1_CLOPA|nr:ABC transporter ATP-binding protein [Clostridium pasteurianum]AGK99155.1 ABC-type multidrug transport system, ATPase and permease component [Clostridium pasteurianum BC1]
MASTMNNIKTAQKKLKHSSNSSFVELLKLAKPHLHKIIIAAICALIVNLTQIAKPYILKFVIDDFLVKNVAYNGIYSISLMAILYLTTAFIGSFVSFAQENLINSAGQAIIKNLRSRVFKIIQFLPLNYLDKTSSGRLITRATNDVEALSEMYTDVIISLFQDFFLLIGIIYAMIMLNIKLTLISFSVIPIMALILILLKKKIKANFLKVKNLIGYINGFMAENISGMRIIQIFRAEREKMKEFLKLNNAYFKATTLQVRLNSILKPGTDFFQNITIAILLFYGINKVSNHSIDLGIIYAFTTYIKQFFNPVSDLADQYTTIQSALVSADRIFELLDEENTLENLDIGIDMKYIEGTIEFKDVWFAYNDRDWVLKGISFKLNRGETAAFIGETGAGKTTIISLINGFYKIQKGEILIDGININNIKLKDLRKNISVVLQDVFLFSGDVKNNITLNDDIDDEQFNKALDASYLKEFLGTFKNGVKEPVMERGNTLSAGQRQLISFARAVAHNPSILVLDEATSNVDTQTEKLIQKAIDNIAKDRTTLIIAHRLSTIKNADKIIVMKNGKIVEIGSHDELITSDSLYKRLLYKNVS